jgi:hypothetical protein
MKILRPGIVGGLSVAAMLTAALIGIFFFAWTAAGLAVGGQAFRIHSMAALTLARLVLTRAMRERSATLGYKHRAPAFGSGQIV